jgi:hypothetical protein
MLVRAACHFLNMLSPSTWDLSLRVRLFNELNSKITGSPHGAKDVRMPKTLDIREPLERKKGATSPQICFEKEKETTTARPPVLQDEEGTKKDAVKMHSCTEAENGNENARKRLENP